MKFDSRLLLGHRGCAHEPENSIAAFERALADGADGIECDVRTTRDGVLVVVHDGEVAGRRVADCTLFELKALLPTLQQVIDFARDRDAVLNVEVKEASVAVVVDALRRSTLLDRIILSTFDHEWLAEAKRLEPLLTCSALLDARLHDPARYVRDVLQADALSPGIGQATPALFESAKRHEVPVLVWTVNEPDEARRLLGLGATAIFTDYPDRLRALFEV